MGVGQELAGHGNLNLGAPLRSDGDGLLRLRFVRPLGLKPCPEIGLLVAYTLIRALTGRRIVSLKSASQMKDLLPWTLASQGLALPNSCTINCLSGRAQDD